VLDWKTKFVNVIALLKKNSPACCQTCVSAKAGQFDSIKMLAALRLCRHLV